MYISVMQTEIENITQHLVAALHPVRIYLFGSRARGDHRIDSDYDIYIVMPNETKKINPLYGTAYCAIQDVRSLPVDLAINTEATFNRRKTGPTLEKIVAREGVVLYERPTGSDKQ